MVYVAMAKDEAFRTAIARAKEMQQDAEVDAMIDIADAATPEDVNVAKLRIWARQWRAAKLAAKKYGVLQKLEHSGPNGGPMKSQVVIATGVPDDDAIA
jgi:RES domain-containing protein